MADLSQTAQNPSGDFIRATPRNPVLGFLSDLVASSYDPQRTQQMQGIAKFFEAPAISQTLDRLSFGEPLTTGAGGLGGTTRMRPEVMQAGLALTDLLPSSAAAKSVALAAPALAGIFIGPKAKTWDALAAQKAKMLADMGTDARSIWQQTGTWKGPDGKWRQEIDDSAAQIENLSALQARDKAAIESQRTALLEEVKAQGGKPTNEQKFRMNNINNQASISGSYRGTLGDVLKHEQLYSAYPNTANVPFNWMEMPTGTSGEYSPSSGIALNMGLFGKDAKSTLLHEKQHAIQGREGFAQGGNPSSMVITLEELANQKRQKAQEMFSLSRANDPLDPLRIVKPGARKKGLELEKEARELEAKALAAYRSEQAKFDLYQRLGGEAEARATQARMNMTPEQRQAMFPEESYDVPINELIIRGVSD
jgi:hypothetical protein